MTEELRNIKKWLSAQEVENPIPSKGLNRVQTSIAKSIRANKPLPTGTCELCSRQSEKLFSAPMKVCKRCIHKIQKHGENIYYNKKNFYSHYCDLCLGRTFTVYDITPNMCPVCCKKLGKTHKFGMPEVRKHKKKEQAKLGGQ